MDNKLGDKGSPDHSGKSSFWKKNMKTVPGIALRPSPVKESRGSHHHSSSSTTMSFQDFQESVSDAWDLGDEETNQSSNVHISKQAAQSAALDVINHHKKSHESQYLYSKSNSVPAISSVHTKIVSNSKSQTNSSDSSSRRPLNQNHKLNFQNSESNTSKLAKFNTLLESPLLDLKELRRLSWSGIPIEVRPMTWRLLAGYLPASTERRRPTLERKRQEYWNFIKQYYDTDRDENYQDTYRQIHIDIPRMSALVKLFQQKTVQEMFERILFIWAIRHPASGYVQGINDLVTPFYVVFLQELLPPGGDIDALEVDSLPKEQRDNVEADSFWCLSNFLDGIQDNYIFAQLGIQTKVNQLKELIQRIDGTLHAHFQKHGIDYLQFSFRWMNNLLTRELPLRCSIRLWDTYLAESSSFALFQLYVCAAFLLNWQQDLLAEQDFQGLMLMLQNLPTSNWTDSDIGVLVAEAYKLMSLFADAPNHLQSSTSTR